MQDILVEQVYTRPAEAMFALLADHETFFPAPRFVCRVLETGQGDRNGNGALREVRSGALRFLERISEFHPGRGYDYGIEGLWLGGLRMPFRHHRGWLSFEPHPLGCQVRWRSRYSVPLPLVGRLLEQRFRRDGGRAFAWLLRDAGRRHGALPETAAR